MFSPPMTIPKPAEGDNVPKQETPQKKFSRAEVSKYDGNGEDGTILLALNGKVYDVTVGKNFYGPGAPYSCFAGRDATRGLATFNLKPRSGDVTEEEDVSNLTERHWESVKRWEELFNAKYTLVGVLKKDQTKPARAPAPPEKKKSSLCVIF